MSKNPFIENDDNPFADSTIQSAVSQSSSGQTHSTFADFPAFIDSRATPINRPAVLNANEIASVSVESNKFNAKKQAIPGTDELLRRQEDLERRAEEIRRREEALNQNTVTNTRAHNWPPLPKCCPIQPCFYQDINIDIPTPFQNTVSRAYRAWIFYFATLILNVIGSVAYFAMPNNTSGALQFGLSIFQVALFTPCSFVLWFRPLYKAFKSDSSMNFMLFFFIQFAQVVCTGVLTVGIPGWSCGFISAIDAITKSMVVGIIMFIVGGFFLLNLLIQLYLLLKIHKFYRTSGLTMARAQSEFLQTAATNRNVQQAAVGIASAAARSQVGQEPRF